MQAAFCAIEFLISSCSSLFRRLREIVDPAYWVADDTCLSHSTVNVIHRDNDGAQKSCRYITVRRRSLSSASFYCNISFLSRYSFNAFRLLGRISGHSWSTWLLQTADGGRILACKLPRC